MDYPRNIYAIYPFDENGHVAGVYVGSTKDVKRRIKAHVFTRDTNKKKDLQFTLHSLMRKNGFSYQILDTIYEFKERHLEYDWMDFFEKQSSLKVFNLAKDCFSPDYRKCGVKKTAECKRLLRSCLQND